MVADRSGILLVAACCYGVFAGFSILHETGWVGATRKSGGAGCICHNPSATDSVLVWISGPESVSVGTRHLYTLSIRRGPAVAGGFDVAAGNGTLDVADDSTHLQDGELTHSSPRRFQGDSVAWSFFYTAPLNGSSDTLFSVGNSVNLNGTPAGDQWNFGTDFVVRLRPDTTLGVRAERRLTTFRLYQNYPNPFNPVTRVSFVLDHSSIVSLTVVDLLGRVVATLLEGRMSAGNHQMEWDGGANPGGVYFCRLSTGSVTEVRKMILLR
jgi:type IX secretion system substrate protein